MNMSNQADVDAPTRPSPKRGSLYRLAGGQSVWVVVDERSDTGFDSIRLLNRETLVYQYLSWEDEEFLEPVSLTPEQHPVIEALLQRIRQLTARAEELREQLGHVTTERDAWESAAYDFRAQRAEDDPDPRSFRHARALNEQARKRRHQKARETLTGKPGTGAV